MAWLVNKVDTPSDHSARVGKLQHQIQPSTYFYRKSFIGTQPHLFTDIYGHFHTTAAQLGSCGVDLKAAESKVLAVWHLRESLLALGQTTATNIFFSKRTVGMEIIYSGKYVYIHMFAFCQVHIIHANKWHPEDSEGTALCSPCPQQLCSREQCVRRCCQPTPGRINVLLFSVVLPDLHCTILSFMGFHYQWSQMLIWGCWGAAWGLGEELPLCEAHWAVRGWMHTRLSSDHSRARQWRHFCKWLNFTL